MRFDLILISTISTILLHSTLCAQILCAQETTQHTSLLHDHGIDQDLIITADANPNTPAFEIQLTILKAPTITLKSLSRVDLQNPKLTAIPNAIDQLKEPFQASDWLWGELSLPHVLISDQQTLIFQIDNQSDHSFIFYSQNLKFSNAPPKISPKTQTIISAQLMQSKPASYGLIAQTQDQTQAIPISGQFGAIFVSEQISTTDTNLKTLKACVSFLNRFSAKQNTRKLERWDWQIACTPNPKPAIASQRIPALDHASHFDQGLADLATDQGTSTHQEGANVSELPFKYAPLTSNLIMLANEHLQWVNLSVYPIVLKAMQQSNALEVKHPSLSTLRSADPHEIFLGTQEGAVLKHPLSDGQVLLVALSNDPIVDQTWQKSRPLLRLITAEQFNFELSMGLNQESTPSASIVNRSQDNWQISQAFEQMPLNRQKSANLTFIYQGSPRTNRYLIASTFFPNASSTSAIPSNSSVPSNFIEIEIRNLSTTTLPFEIQGHVFAVVSIDQILLMPPPEYQQLQIQPRSTYRIRFSPIFYPIVLGALSVPEGQMGLSFKIEQ